MLGFILVLLLKLLKKIFEEEGLNPFNYSLLCYDEWDDIYEEVLDKEEILGENMEVIEKATTKKVKIKESGNRYGIRYEELLCFIISAL